MPSRRAVVEVSAGTVVGARLWGYGYADLSTLLGVAQGTVRAWVASGRLDPRDLLAVCRAVVRAQGGA